MPYFTILDRFILGTVLALAIMIIAAVVAYRLSEDGASASVVYSAQWALVGIALLSFVLSSAVVARHYVSKRSKDTPHHLLQVNTIPGQMRYREMMSRDTWGQFESLLMPFQVENDQNW